MNQYRLKAAPVTAVQFDGKTMANGTVNQTDAATSVRTNHGVKSIPARHGLLPTLDGPVLVAPGDWVVTGADGLQSVCKAADFEATYEPVGSDAPAQSSAATPAPAPAAQPAAPAVAPGAPYIH